jgi:hypothetical protein
MKYFDAKKCKDRLPYERAFSLDSAGRDYSEEAIPERDPAYSLPSGNVSAEATMEAVSPETRLELTRRLEQLGMSRVRALAVASL